MKHLCWFYKVFSNKFSKYIHEVAPLLRYSFGSPNKITAFLCSAAYFKSSFFVYVMNDWNKLEPEICNSSFYVIHRNSSEIHNSEYIILQKYPNKLH